MGQNHPTVRPAQVGLGNTRQKRVMPCSELAVAAPPWASTMALVIYSPNPAPSDAGWDRAGSAR